MNRQMVKTEIVVLGSGLPGSTMALVLNRLGFDVLVIDKAVHPRFAIGESSTPTADAYLAEIADQFELPELKPLTTYGSTRETYPDLTIGLKRGFSYFFHANGIPFHPGENHENELVVSASSHDARSDSHWLRSDIDAFAVSLFEKHGVQFFQDTQVQSIEDEQGKWLLHLQTRTQPAERFENVQVRADYFIDATGASGIGIRSQGGTKQTQALKTNTRATFAHFEGLKRWSAFFNEQQSSDHPFLCDNAAVHQILDQGWMWQLRFNSGMTSCGIVTSNDFAHSHSPGAYSGKTHLENFMNTVGGYPSLEEQFACARAITPENGAFFHKRIQHLFDRGCGPRWCSLPNTLGFVDPLHSKGLAHAFSGVFRLAQIFKSASSLDTRNLKDAVEKLMDAFRLEILFLDRLISICYLTINDFDRFRQATYWYFAAATNSEKNRKENLTYDCPFLFSENSEFCEKLFEFHRQLSSIPLRNRHTGKGKLQIEETRWIEKQTRMSLAPFDHVGLFEPPIRNMYKTTAAPKKPNIL